MKTNVIVRGAQKSAEKVLMANVVACTGIISMVEKVQELSFNKAVVCRSSRKGIEQKQAAMELAAQHQAVCDKARASAERIKAMMSRKSKDIIEDIPNEEELEAKLHSSLV